MKWKKQVLCLLVVAIATIGLVSCRQRAETSATPPKRVFVILPLTGAAASWGDHFKRGAEMFSKTVPNPKIDVKVIDSQSNPAAALSALRQAALGGKPYAVVSTLSSITIPVKEWTDSEGIFLVACVVTDKVLDNKGLTQRVYPSVESNARPLAEYAKTHFKKVAILNSNEELGTSVRRVFERDYIGDDRKVILADAYALKDTEVRTLVTKFVQAAPEGILVTGIGPAFWAIIKELRAQKYPGVIMSDVSFADQAQIESLGPLADGVIFMGSETELTEPRTEHAKAFSKQFRDSFNAPVNYTGVTVYESLRILNALAERKEAVSNADVLALGEWPGVPGPIRFLPNGDCAYPWFLVSREAARTTPVP